MGLIFPTINKHGALVWAHAANNQGKPLPTLQSRAKSMMALTRFLVRHSGGDTVWPKPNKPTLLACIPGMGRRMNGIPAVVELVNKEKVHCLLRERRGLKMAIFIVLTLGLR